MAEHGKRADCSRDPVVVKAAIKLVRRAGHKVNSQMLGSNQECMTTHEKMADCSQVLRDTSTQQTAVLGEEAKVGLWRRRRSKVGLWGRRRRSKVGSWGRRRRSAPKIKCSQPKLPRLKCPTGFMPVKDSIVHEDKVEKGVRLLARGVTCKCTKMPSNKMAILKEASKCSVTVYKKQNHQSKLRTFTTSKPKGTIFTNNAELGEEENVELGAEEKVGLWRRRRRTDKDWGSYIKSAKIEGACAQVEYAGASSTVAYAGVLSMCVSDDDKEGCQFNNPGCLSRCVRRLREAVVVCR